MKHIKYSEALEGSNSDTCKTLEYSFDDKDIDFGIAIINGRYPESGYALNLVSKELFYILEGEGEICFENEIISFKQGDAILVENNQKHYLNSNYCKVSMSCTPSWTLEQHKIVE